MKNKFDCMTEISNIVNTVIDLNVSYQENTWSEITRETKVISILNQIKSGEHKIKINNLRQKLESGNKEYYDNFKKQLPAVTFSATFNLKRTYETLKQYNPIIVLDIDKLNQVQLKETYQYLINDEYVFSFWRSPSNSGYKGLVIVDYKVNCEDFDLDILHKSAFKQLSEYFLINYNIELDKSGSDITRLCFLSYDEDLIQKSSIKKFEINSVPITLPVNSKNKTNLNSNTTSHRNALYNPHERNSQFDRKIMSDIIRYLKNKKLSITYNYEDWCKVAMSISNTFTFDIGLNYFLKLSSLDSDKYSEIICTNFLINCYETKKGNISFRSIVYLANKKGYKTQSQKNGVAKEEG